MSGDQMSIFGLWIKSPGIKCPFWCWGSKVRGSNVHFRVRDQTSSGSNVYFMSGIKCPRDRMSSGSIVNPFYGIENPKSKVWGSKVRGSSVHHPFCQFTMGAITMRNFNSGLKINLALKPNLKPNQINWLLTLYVNKIQTGGRRPNKDLSLQNLW